MHLVTFLQHGQVRLGAFQLEDAHKVLVDLNRAEPSLPVSMLDFLAADERVQKLADEVIRRPPATAIVGKTINSPLLTHKIAS